LLRHPEVLFKRTLAKDLFPISSNVRFFAPLKMTVIVCALETVVVRHPEVLFVATLSKDLLPEDATPRVPE
jgi:hypothetical protein